MGFWKFMIIMATITGLTSVIRLNKLEAKTRNLPEPMEY